MQYVLKGVRFVGYNNYLIVNFTVMKKLLLLIFTVLISYFGYSQNSPDKNLICADVFDYEILNGSDEMFTISITKSTTDDFTLKLFSIDGKESFIKEIITSSSSKSFEFKNLNRDNVYLIQVYGMRDDCRFTIGGIEGIKYENK
jgi:hypothetical protein